MVQEVNTYFSDIYFNLHPIHEVNLSHQQVRILQVVHKKRHIMIRDIAMQLSISQNTASEHVKKLVGNGWLIKERSAEDQRKVYLNLTPEGISVLKNHTELDETKLTVVLERLTLEEQNKIIDALRLLSEVSK